jgi:hypothetical protein
MSTEFYRSLAQSQYRVATTSELLAVRSANKVTKKRSGSQKNDDEEKNHEKRRRKIPRNDQRFFLTMTQYNRYDVTIPQL